ncbi:HD domain-containing protein [Caldinitratiruptor microaerophilus]|uniref:Nucleotidyltransferase n=1 Tax=Caldinitratiruptor microaerophilus TaxID=671077 RepID=A0AA35CLP9_9FIRM|nr:HD domain-containing protein [Caldinitratiruptor microaerophilus]BDG60819.1 nucleotidyltransferase [Caldinitratiruptor microaerophilus]
MVIRDPIHGDIDLTAEEARVLDTREMQRLRGIKQLGTAYLVYPGCTHTRFDHSLGTLAAASRILAHLGRSGFDIPAADAALVRMAALVHDVTHVPFGHTFEDEREIFPRHDDGHRTEAFFGDRSELGQVLKALGLRDGVLDLLSGRGPSPWMAEVVSSTVDADLLDYLRRDAYFAGLRRDYDDRIFSYFTLDGGHLVMNMLRHGLERPDARSEIVHLLHLRYFLTERVYLHHTKIAAGAMIAKAVEIGTRTWLTEERLYTLTDEQFLDLLAGFPDPDVQELAARLRARRLYKRAYVLSGQSLGAQQAQIIQRFSGPTREHTQLEEAIARRARVRPAEVILYCPRASYIKEAQVPVRTRQGVQPLAGLDSPLSGDVGALARQYADLWRLYVFAPPERVEVVRTAAREVFGLPSEYAGKAAAV